MGRGNLSRLLPLVLVLAVAAPPAAASTLPFHLSAHGIATGAASREPFALVATSRLAVHKIVLDVPPGSAQPVLRANYRTSIVLGVFGPFGCKDGRVRVSRVTQSGRMLTVHLSIKPLARGVMECHAVYETFRVLVVPRTALHGVPAKASVTVAGT